MAPPLLGGGSKPPYTHSLGMEVAGKLSPLALTAGNNRAAACVHLVRLVSVNRLSGFVSVDRRHTRGGTRARSLAAMRPISRTRNVSLSLAIVYPPYLLLYTPIPASTARLAPAQAGRRSVHPISRPGAHARGLVPPRSSLCPFNVSVMSRFGLPAMSCLRSSPPPAPRRCCTSE